jgi:hypothetical protein
MLLSKCLSKNYFKPNNKIRDDFYEKIPSRKTTYLARVKRKKII